MNISNGRAMIFKSPGGELYFNPFSLTPLKTFALPIKTEKSIYDYVIKTMGTLNFAFFEYDGEQHDDYSVTISRVMHFQSYKTRFSTSHPITVALDFEYHTLFKGQELTPYELDRHVSEMNEDLLDYPNRMSEFKNNLVLKPILMCGTDYHDRLVFDVRATRTTRIDKELRAIFTHELADQPFKAWVYNAKCEFEIIIPLLLKAGYVCQDKFVRDLKASQMVVSCKGPVYYSLEVLTWKPVYHGDAKLRQPSYIKDTYRDLYRLLGSGSLKNNAESFQLKNHHGKPVNKSEWDWTDPANTPYDDAGTLKDKFVEYCKQDCITTYSLLKASRATIRSTGEIMDVDLDQCITAGGVAKRIAINSMLRAETGVNKYSINNKAFNEAIGLYNAPEGILTDIQVFNAVKGGLGLFNARYYGQRISKAVYSDISSAYPYMMSIMNIPTYNGMVINDSLARVPGEIGSMILLRIKYLHLKPGYAPLIYDRDSKFLIFDRPSNSYFLNVEDEMFDYPVFSSVFPELDEMRMIQETYDIKFLVRRVYHFMDSGLRFGDYINKFFDLKQKSKGVNNALVSISKLILNSSYGKMCQNMFLTKTRFTLKDDILQTDVVEYLEGSEEYNKQFKVSGIRAIGGFITSMQRTRLARVAHDLYSRGKKIYLLATDCIVYSYDGEFDCKESKLGDFDQVIIEDFTGWSQKGYKYIKPKETDPKKRFNLHMNGLDAEQYATQEKFPLFQPGIIVPTAANTRIEGGNVIISTNKYFQIQKDDEFYLHCELGGAILKSDRG